MRRLLAVFGVLLAVLAVAGPTAGAAAPHRGFVFYTHADGFYLEGRSTVGSGRVRLFLYRDGEVAYYYVKARVGPGTLSARFGRLGSVELRFAPARDTGPLGCGNEEGGWQAGRFRGAIRFHGEHHYADIHAGTARGWFATLPREGCGNGDRRAPRSASARASRIGPIAETSARLTATRGPKAARVLFYAVPDSRRQNERIVNFGAFLDEMREGMAIERGGETLGGAKSFEWDLRTGTARLAPSAPFTGRAFYRRGAPGRPARWSGSLRVPILGGKPLRLTGSAFDIHLGRGT
jgi:hypothetical protein